MKNNGFLKPARLLLMMLIMLTVFCVPVKAEETEEGEVDNGIPIVYLNIDESRGTIDDMLESMDHSVYCYGTISIEVPEGFHYSDFRDTACESLENLEMSIRGRGNSTWEMQKKKPFKIKLEKKADVLGLGENKHWALLANVFDSTLMRDRITAWLGDEMGFDFTPRGVPVDVIMRGENYGTHYLGSYYLTENVRVDNNRLEIDELKETDTDPLTITGGYLIQNSFQVDKNSPDRFKTTRGAEWATETPSFDVGEESSADDGEKKGPLGAERLGDGYENHAQQEYIQNYIQMFEDVLYEQGTAYRDLMDIESAAKYWLVQTFTLNGDAYATGSTYFYKERDTADQVGKIYWGPLWDFDFAWDKQVYIDDLPYGHMWMKPMLYDTEEGGFVQEIHKQWDVMRIALNKLIENGGIIDQYYEETKASALQDENLYYPEEERNYQNYVEKLKKWIIDRSEWVSENIDTIEGMIHKVTFMVDGEVYRTDFMSEEEYIDGSEPYPEKEGYVFVGWFDENGIKIDSQTYITQDRTIKAKYLSDEEATHGQDIAFNKNSDVIPYNVHVTRYQIPYLIIPTDAMDQKIEWSSSDENYATVDERGMVSFNGPGTVTLTANLKFGNTREYTLTVLEGELPMPTAIHPDEDSFELTVGDQACLSINTEPELAKIYEYDYESADANIATIGQFGVITAVSEGETTVSIRAIARDENDNDVIFETNATVTVKAKPMIRNVRKTDSTGLWVTGIVAAAAIGYFIFRKKKHSQA